MAAIADMDRTFRLLWIRQSDGKTKWFNTKLNDHELNAPPKVKTLNSQKGEMTYDELDFSDKRHKEWRKRLGTLLVQDMIDKKNAAGESTGDLETTKYVLGALPENYKLFEGTRWEGTKCRKEVFVYGHPEGPKKRYRAAREFVPHLTWLCNDENLDPRNCECKFCAPQDTQKAFEDMTKFQAKAYGIKIEDEKPPNTTASNKGAQAPSGVPVRKNSTNNDVKPQIPAQQPPIRSISTSVPETVSNNRNLDQQRQADSKPNQPQRQVSNPNVFSMSSIAATQKPTPPVPVIDPDQRLDFLPKKFMFRQGEIVWFTRDGGQGSVGIAAVVDRFMVSHDGVERPNYTVQPLSHPFHHPNQEQIYIEDLLKPWLAFSPPATFHEGLREVNMHYSKLPWKEIIGGAFGPGDAEADGSIFAARTVDGTYTPFGPLSVQPTQTSYNGVFFGGEKIWRGEAMRLSGSTGDAQILIVSEILEITSTPGQPAQLIFQGDIYVWKHLKAEEKTPPPNAFLPNLVKIDLAFRNQASRSAGKGTAIWHFVKARAQISWEDLKGRWYPSQYLVPSLCGDEEFQDQIARGDVIDAGSKINGQSDYSTTEPGKGRTILKRDTRALAFGAAIPSSGIDFGLADSAYTTLISSSSNIGGSGSGRSSANAKSAPTQQSQQQRMQSQAQAQAQVQAKTLQQRTLQAQYQAMTPEERAQVQRMLAMQQQQQLQQAAQQQQRFQPDLGLTEMDSSGDAMDVDGEVDFGQFIN